MYNQVPFDILTEVFSFLPPDSLACASSVCKQWHHCVSTCVSTGTALTSHRYPPWFLAVPTPNRRHSSYVYNPVLGRWYFPSLEFLSFSISPIASIGNLILYKSSAKKKLTLRFGLCNPLTKQNWYIPPPLIDYRINPAVGVVVADRDPTNPKFKIFLFGGITYDTYELVLKMYDSEVGDWQNLGSIPTEIVMKLTHWTSNDGVYSKGFLYWIIPSLKYKVIGYELGTGKWKELDIPTTVNSFPPFFWLVQRNEALTLILVTSGREGWIWELGVEDKWVFVEKVPSELANMFFCYRKTWKRISCAGNDKAIYLYTESGSEMLVWRQVCEKGRWEWSVIEGCGSIKGQKLENFPIKGLLFQPSLYPSYGVPN